MDINFEELFDSRDLKKEINELTDLKECTPEEDWLGSNEEIDLEDYLNLWDQLSSSAQEYGTTIISDDYFAEAVEDDFWDVFNLRALPSIITDHINWDRVAEDEKTNYYPVDFRGQTYWVRD